MTEQTPAPAPAMKPCPYCGKMTSTKANFCYWCTRELAARPERPEPSSSSKAIHLPSWGWIAIGVMVVAAVIAFSLLR